MLLVSEYMNPRHEETHLVLNGIYSMWTDKIKNKRPLNFTEWKNEETLDALLTVAAVPFPSIERFDILKKSDELNEKINTVTLVNVNVVTKYTYYIFIYSY